jgi:hypothetical protein
MAIAAHSYLDGVQLVHSPLWEEFMMLLDFVYVWYHMSELQWSTVIFQKLQSVAYAQSW